MSRDSVWNSFDSPSITFFSFFSLLSVVAVAVEGSSFFTGCGFFFPFLGFLFLAAPVDGVLSVLDSAAGSNFADGPEE